MIAVMLMGLCPVASPSLGATKKASAGEAIYGAECARCHGRKGEGVKGKYDDGLHGDWAIEKLIRYIDKNMPEDDPDKCNGPEAEAVARYIYDAFYSREARARNHPPRVELVRLTNRQYVNTIADLIKSFTGSDAPVGNERGLQARYYGSRNLREGREELERVDRQVDFDFGEGRPEPTPEGTNGFSIQWRGALLAEETGDYEFILKTPNGARLWLNDNETPLIDAWVASGERNEHKAAIRLLGGRAYPLKLDFFKFKDKAASISLQWKPPRGVQETIPARSLSPARVTPTFVVMTPFPPDDSSVGYERGVSVSKAWDEAATQAAIDVANYLVKQLEPPPDSERGNRRRGEAERRAETNNALRLLASVVTNRATRLESFCSEFVATAFRRPLTDDQKRMFVSSQFKNAANAEEAIKRVVLLALKSPRFLYLGLEGAHPDDHEAAARLSFGLWDSLPDTELMKIAAERRLHTREQVTQQVQRMLADPRARAKVRYFLQHWLQMEHVENLSKDDKLFPGFTAEIIADLRTSLNLFLDDVVWSATSDYRRLLLDDDLFVNDRLAKFYGVDIPQSGTTDDFVKVSLDPKQRSGVLTHPYLLAAFSYPKSTSPIHRGVFLTRNIVGRALKPPPMAVEFDDAKFAPNMTMREKVAELTRSQACQGCHSVINPLGFSLEYYDAVGRFRTHDRDRPIDTVSDYTTDEGRTVRLKGARDVAEFAARSEQAQNAFIEQLFHSIVKQPMLAYGRDVPDRLRRAFAASGFNIQKLAVEIATLSALHGVKETAPRKPAT